MASLSERLKRERELRGISLKQISEETRIGVRFLQALEEDRVDVIPGEFYRRSYLRAYARYLGLDEDRALNAYDFSKKEKREGDEIERAESSTKLPSWLKWIVASIAIVVPAVLLLRAMPAAPGGSASMASDPVSPYGRSPSPPAASALDPETPFPPEAAATPGSPFPAGSEGALRLLFSVEESCWLEIEADGEIAISGLKEAGFRQEVVAHREIRMWLGNAGGVNLLVNDRPAKPLGRPGQVRKDLTITPENFREFVASEERS